MNTLISIITVCYNSEKTIEKTINSVLNQKNADYEYIIVDGASTDGTLNIIKKYEPFFSGKLTLISEKDNGIYDAMNKGIKASKGRIIGILNSDDYFEEDALFNVSKHITDDKYQVIYGMTRIINKTCEEAVVRFSHENLNNKMMNHPSCFVSKAVYDDIAMFDTQYISAADYDFMLRVRDSNKVKFIPINSITTVFLSGGISSGKIGHFDMLKVKKNHGMISEKEYNKILSDDKKNEFRQSIKRFLKGIIGKK